jgi:hypothetical protein
MSRTFHASRDARRSARKARRATRADLDAMRPFIAGWRDEMVRTYTREELERVKAGLPGRRPQMTIGD